MTMLYPEEFWATYGFGAKVYDATGREMRPVIACNPETGEAIICAKARVSPMDWLRWRLRCIKPRLRWEWIYGGEPCKRHGFWPAPLRVVPKPVWPGGPVPDGQAYIVGNGEREALL